MWCYRLALLPLGLVTEGSRSFGEPTVLFIPAKLSSSPSSVLLFELLSSSPMNEKWKQIL
jgi:hypothetical protein